MFSSGDRVVVESGRRSGETGFVKYASDDFCYVVVNINLVNESKGDCLSYEDAFWVSSEKLKKI